MKRKREKNEKEAVSLFYFSVRLIIMLVNVQGDRERKSGNDKL